MSAIKIFLARLAFVVWIALAGAVVLFPSSPASAQPASSSGGEFVFTPLATIIELIGAAAEEIKAELREGAYGEIMDGLVMIYEFCIEQYDEFLKKLATGYRARIKASELAQQTKMMGVQAVIDSASHNRLARAHMNYYVEKTPPKHEYLCKAVTALSSVGSGMDHERELSRAMAEAINNRYRCSTCDGSGPDYVAHESKRACQRKYGTLVSGDAASCRDTGGVKAPDGRSLAGAQIAPIDGMIYEMPPTISKTTKDPASGQSIVVNMPADSGLTVRQEFWHAAWDHCFLLAGPRPTPPSGAAMKKPHGKTARAMYNHCVASQNALVKQCTDLVAFYTRPNCKDNPTLCDKQLTKCAAAWGIVNLDPYDNCTAGLSPSEEYEIAQGICKSGQHYSSNAQSGQSQSALQRSIGKCEAMDKSYRDYVAQKQSNYERATQAMQRLKPCWAAVESLTRGADASQGRDSALVPAASAQNYNDGLAATQSSLQTISARAAPETEEKGEENP